MQRICKFFTSTGKDIIAFHHTDYLIVGFPFNMHCYICVTYLMIIATAHPPKDREVSKRHEKRSIFNDVIQSLRMRSQLPEDINLNDENNLGLNYDKYAIENESLQQPNDLDFMPRRNDRIEMPSLKYRFPKSLEGNLSSPIIPKEEIVVYVNTPVEYSSPETSTQKPKKPRRTRPPINKNKNTSTKEDEDTTETFESKRPFMNSMAGQSQIGNRESQTVVKPTVIVNLRGSVIHRESEIRLERRQNKNDTVIPQNIFNINQEVNVEKSDAGMKKSPKLRQGVKINSDIGKTQIEEDMMMCETSSAKDKDRNNRSSRKYDVLQILFTI